MATEAVTQFFDQAIKKSVAIARGSNRILRDGIRLVTLLGGDLD